MMRHSLFTRAFPALTLCSVALFSSGCASTSTPSAEVRPAAAATAPVAASASKDRLDRRETVKRLAKGMNEHQVLGLLGEPERKVPQKTALGEVDAWIYRSTYTAGTRHIQTGSEKYSRPNPITNVMETIEEPIYGVESVFVTEDHVLVFRRGVLLEWKTVASQSKNVS